MKKIIIFLSLILLTNCGFKHKVSCDLSLKDKSISGITNNCIKTPQMAISKEF